MQSLYDRRHWKISVVLFGGDEIEHHHFVGRTHDLIDGMRVQVDVDQVQPVSNFFQGIVSRVDMPRC